MTNLIKKYVMVEPKIWEKVESLGKEPGQQRAASHQGGVILRRYIESNEGNLSMKTIWKGLIGELDEIIAEIPLEKDGRIQQLLKKREQLEKAFHAVEG